MFMAPKKIDNSLELRRAEGTGHQSCSLPAYERPFAKRACGSFPSSVFRGAAVKLFPGQQHSQPKKTPKSWAWPAGITGPLRGTEGYHSLQPPRSLLSVVSAHSSIPIPGPPHLLLPSNP